MPQQNGLLASERIVQFCLVVLALIALCVGFYQLFLGQPESGPRLDHLHRFLAGTYAGLGLVAVWTAVTIRSQNGLVYIVALAVLLGGVGRLQSVNVVGLPEPTWLWFLLMAPEFVLPLVVVVAQIVTNRNRPA